MHAETTYVVKGFDQKDGARSLSVEIAEAYRRDLIDRVVPGKVRSLRSELRTEE